MIDSAQLEREFAELKWFHSIDFGDFASSGRFRPGSPQNITLYGFMDLIQHVDLSGMSVLDVGAVDGLSSFGMKKLGAEKVTATDSVDKETFRKAREFLGLDINYFPCTQLRDFPDRFEPGEFDLVLCGGVIYHMLNPMSAFLQCRKVIKENGLLIMETAYEPSEKRACVFLNSETEMVNELYTYSVPSQAAVTGMMKLAGFDVLAIRHLRSTKRITVLGRATSLDNVRNRTPLLERIHERELCDYEFQFGKDLPSPQSSSIQYTGREDEKDIDYNKFAPSFPFHPSKDKRTVGKTIWLSESGNH